MSEGAPEFASNGDIYVHGRDELPIRVQFPDQDMTGHPVWFEIHNVVRRLLPDDGNTRLMTITAADLALIPASGADYILRDELASPKRVLLEGKIRWRGWNK